MKKFCFLSALLCSFSLAYTQEFNLEELRQAVVQNNGQLLAQKFEIGAARAQVIQAKLIPNPSLSVSELNLWKNGTTESFPYIAGKFGQHQQISVELEQTIELAGKRRKRVILNELIVKETELDYEELLRSLQLELDEAYWNFFTAQTKEVLVDSLTILYGDLHNSYKRQVDLENISLSDYLRIQSTFLNLQKEHTELIADRNNWLAKIRMLTHINDLEIAQVKEPLIQEKLSMKVPPDLDSLILNQNIGLQWQINETKKQTQNWVIEKAEKTPDLSLSMNYDRGGNIMQDFVGLGLRMDLPLFNKNKGNIESAKLSTEKSIAQENVLKNQLRNQLITLWDQLKLYENTLNKFDNNKLSDDHRMLLRNYQKNLLTKQITVLEFTDFIEAYQESQMGQMELRLAYHLAYAQLEYLAGKNF